MRRTVVGVLIASLALSGCAGRTKPPSDASSAKAAASARPCMTSSKSARWREMTWAEYYNEIRERAWKRGIMVVWITPPEVTKRKREAAHAAMTACTQ